MKTELRTELPEFLVDVSERLDLTEYENSFLMVLGKRRMHFIALLSYLWEYSSKDLKQPKSRATMPNIVELSALWKYSVISAVLIWYPLVLGDS